MLKRSVIPHAGALLCLLALAAPAAANPGLMAPSKLDFGGVDVHFGGAPRQSVLLSNMSSEDVELGALGVSGPDGAAFRITNDGCSEQTVKAFSSCSLEVEFQPGTRGAKAATLEVPAGESLLEVALAGTGTTGTLSSNPETLHFGPIPYTHPGVHEEGEQNENEQLNVTDSPDAGVQTQSVSIVGPDASSFSIQYGNCAYNLLAPNNTCGMGIRFQPDSPGPKHAALLIENDGGGGPLSIPLEGEGREGPRFSASTSQALLGDVPLGGSRAQVFTITNTGDYPLFIQQSFLVSGTPLMFPKTSDTCSGQIVEPGSSCEMTVLFQPTTAGQKDAALIVIANSIPGINVLGIDGAGVSEPPRATSPPAHSSIVPRHLRGAPRIAPAGPRNAMLRRGTLTTGVLASCPSGHSHCEALSFLTTTLPVHSSGARGSAELRLLGSATVGLHERGRSYLHVHLSRSGLALLRRERHLSVTLTTVLRAGRGTIASHSRTLILTA
jgi:Abnormal spindle-like microcephaly-assoc'd, ASPM-SPD-2-Hydin